MDAQSIKDYIFSNDKVETVLENLEMHHIQWHNGKQYVTCGMPDGDNPNSTVIYCDNSFLQVKAYTRDIIDPYGISDIISLVSFVRGTIFSQSINWLCEIFGLDYYSNMESTQDFTNIYMKLRDSFEKRLNIEDLQLKPLPENTLMSYVNWNNTIFRDDNISEDTQTEFEIGLDVFSHRITIPIRDELGRLVGVKGRLAWEAPTEWNPKYIYLHQCAKSRICYGLYKTLPYIQEQNTIIVCEAEKGVMQLWDLGFRNAISVGGHSISQYQQDLIIQSGAAKVIIAFDKDVDEDTVKKEAEKIALYRNVEYIIDYDNLLGEKESPMDNPNKWFDLYDKYRIMYRK